jgi:hypothetical protein
VQDSVTSIHCGTPMPERATCGVPGCGKKLNRDNSTGFCRPHRAATSRAAPRLCALCDQELQARNKTGFCHAHSGHTPNAVERKALERAQAEERRSQWRECGAGDCTRRLRPDNKSGRCWEHNYVPVSAAEREQCSFEGCTTLLSPKNTIGRCTEHKDPRWVAAECGAEGCTKKLNVTNRTGYCELHADAHRRDYQLRRAYGITTEEYYAMLAAQNGVCALCGNPPREGGKGAAGKLHVDHDHETRRVRALLCTNCNLGLGKFREDARLMRAAADYVEMYAALHAQAATEEAGQLF